MAGDTWANTSLLQEHRRRALALFPELETCGHEFYAFMSLYAREIPWKFFDRGSATKTLEVLREIRATSDRRLLSFFKDRHGEIEIAIRSLHEINRAAFHDRDWSLADLEQIRDIRELIHPAYLQLCEGVQDPAPTHRGVSTPQKPQDTSSSARITPTFSTIGGVAVDSCSQRTLGCIFALATVHGGGYDLGDYFSMEGLRCRRMIVGLWKLARRRA